MQKSTVQTAVLTKVRITLFCMFQCICLWSNRSSMALQVASWWKWANIVTSVVGWSELLVEMQTREAATAERLHRDQRTTTRTNHDRVTRFSLSSTSSASRKSSRLAVIGTATSLDDSCEFIYVNVLGCEIETIANIWSLVQVFGSDGWCSIRLIQETVVTGPGAEGTEINERVDGSRMWTTVHNHDICYLNSSALSYLERYCCTQKRRINV